MLHHILAGTSPCRWMAFSSYQTIFFFHYHKEEWGLHINKSYVQNLSPFGGHLVVVLFDPIHGLIEVVFCVISKAQDFFFLWKRILVWFNCQYETGSDNWSIIIENVLISSKARHRYCQRYSFAALTLFSLLSAMLFMHEMCQLDFYILSW